MVVMLLILVVMMTMVLVVVSSGSGSGNGGGMMVLAWNMVLVSSEVVALASRVPSAPPPVRPSARCLRNLPRHTTFHHEHG